ncbi:hypothetical protein CMI37_19190 [Candidatus Pacearchaeota archaeon]|nr:hypothetical protein [Candidatus Pacearchaeota archaeon]
MAMGDYLDVRGAGSGQATPLQPEERQMQRIQRVISAAEASNYDGDPEYYNQIKAIAMQAGIPIKGFKSNPFRALGILGMSALDTSLGGILPNSLYTPEGGHVSTMDAAADTLGLGIGALNPIGVPAKLFGGAKALTMGGAAISKLGKPSRSLINKIMGQSKYRQLSQKTGGFSSKGGKFMAATPKPDPVKKAKDIVEKTKTKVKTKTKTKVDKPVVKTKTKTKTKTATKTGAARVAETKQLVDKIKKIAPEKNREMLMNTPIPALKAILKNLTKKKS